MGVAGSDVELIPGDCRNSRICPLQSPHLARHSSKHHAVDHAISGLAIRELSGMLSLPVAVLVHKFREVVAIASGLRLLRIN